MKSMATRNILFHDQQVHHYDINVLYILDNNNRKNLHVLLKQRRGRAGNL